MPDEKKVSTVGKGTLLVASTLTVMAGATIAPSLPAMQAAFSDHENAAFLVRQVLTFPALFIVLGALAAGWTVDRFGRKPLLIVCVVLYAIAGSSGFYLNSLTAILVGRALLGLAVAGIMTSVTTLIADYLEGEARARLLGLQAAFMSLGGVLFLLFGGVLADASWRFPFLIYLFSLLLLPFAIVSLFEPRRAKTTPENAPTFLPLVLESRALMAIFGLAFLGMTVFYFIPVQIPFHLQAMGGASGTGSGIAIAASNLVGAIAAVQYKRLRTTLAPLRIYALSFLLMSIGFAIIGTAGSYALVLLGLAVTGAGTGFLLPNAGSWLTSLVPEALRGRSVGALTMAIFLGQFVSPFISQPLGALVGIGNSFLLIGGLLFALAAALFFAGQQQDAVVAAN